MIMIGMIGNVIRAPIRTFSATCRAFTSAVLFVESAEISQPSRIVLSEELFINQIKDVFECNFMNEKSENGRSRRRRLSA